MKKMCHRCGKREAQSKDGFCIPCMRNIVHEAKQGLLQFEPYLLKWDGFQTHQNEKRKKRERKMRDDEMKRESLRKKHKRRP